MKKTVCFIAGQRDRGWIETYKRSVTNEEEIVYLATSLGAQTAAREAGLPYKTYEEKAWELDQEALWSKALQHAHFWHQSSQEDVNKILQKIKYFKSYPLLAMHFDIFLICFYEALQSFVFMQQILKIEKPNKIIVGKADPFIQQVPQPPFDLNVFSLLTRGRGFELEALKTIANQLKIEYLEFLPSDPCGKKENVLLAEGNTSFDFPWDSSWTGPKVLFVSWAGHNLKQFLAVFEKLLKKKARIFLLLLGGQLSKEDEAIFKERKVFVFYQENILLPEANRIYQEWQTKGATAFSEMMQSDYFSRFFSDGNVSYFPFVVEEVFKNELIHNIPHTILELMRTEVLLQAFKPKLLVTNFVTQPWNLSYIFPAKEKNIPTLGISHGIGGELSAFRDNFGTDYYAVSGHFYQKKLEEWLDCPQESLVPIGDVRLEEEQRLENMEQVKIRLGFDPNRPLCILCTNAGNHHSVEKRHSNVETLRQGALLKKAFPKLQIVVRTRNGADLYFMKQFFKDTGILFQNSQEIPLVEIVQASDFVIAHYSSVVMESLVNGVRVIYLCALSMKEPAYLGFEAIKVADKFELLQKYVEEILSVPMEREAVLSMAQPFFDQMLCGRDSRSKERLENIILKLAKNNFKIPEKDPFDDWKKREHFLVQNAFQVQNHFEKSLEAWPCQEA